MGALRAAVLVGSALAASMAGASAIAADCSPPQVLVAERPPPETTWTVSNRPSRLTFEGLISVTGTVRGHGDVCAEVIGTRKLGKVEQRVVLFRDRYSLNAGGSEKTFAMKFTVPETYAWTLEVVNCGVFRGYCSRRTAGR